MLMYSLRASTLKFFAVVCVALVTLITLIAFVPTYGEGPVDVPTSGDVEISYDKVKSEEDRVKFLSQFGWEIKTPAVTSGEVTIPSEFDKVFTGYNEIQKRQGICIQQSAIYKNIQLYDFQGTASGNNHII